MIRRIITALVLVPLAIVLVLLAVANRQSVTLSLDPSGQAPPALAVTLPLYQLIFILVIAGVLLGGCAAWLKQSRWRRRARGLESEVLRLHAEAAARGGANAPKVADAPRLTIPSSAA